MVAFGPWTQDPDYDEVPLWEPEDRYRTLEAIGEPTQSEGEFSEQEVFESGPPWPTSPYANLGSLLSNALVADNAPGPLYAPSNGLVSLSYVTAVASLNYIGSASAAASASIAPVVPGYPTEGEPLGVYPFRYYPEDEPEDAIDIEYEGDNPLGIPEWLTVAIDPATTLTGVIRERIDRPGEFSFQEAVSRSFASEIRVAGGWPGPQGGTRVHEMSTAPGEYTTVAGNQRRSLGSTVSLSPHVPSSGGVLWIRTPDYVPASVAPDGGSGDWDWSYGWGFLRLYYRWTLRPPRYRWVYDSTPHRRITQRGDSLAGGARRIGGRVKTIQGSNRRGAGSVV